MKVTCESCARKGTENCNKCRCASCKGHKAECEGCDVNDEVVITINVTPMGIVIEFSKPCIICPCNECDSCGGVCD